ncbi:hypothetical protein ACIPRD_26740 [Streptomyces sp. NPDC090108]|uniref:hypothetical protein n=1 Tax=Streptomyces sp. NPDC090108 TaxID=3365947 RepID=UPI003814C907
MKTSLPVENAGDTDICLFIEPYGEDFWMKPGDAFEVVPLSDANVHFSVVVANDVFTVWLYQDGDPYNILLDYKVTGVHGEELTCGHQRPADSADK